MKSICGIDCNKCSMKSVCAGCKASEGKPFGGSCITCKCIKENCLDDFKNKIIKEFNALKIKDCPKLDTLCALCGSFVNMEYKLGNKKVKLLDDSKIYLGYQLEKKNSDRCIGIVADDEVFVVCEYGCNGEKLELLVYKKR